MNTLRRSLRLALMVTMLVTSAMPAAAKLALPPHTRTTLPNGLTVIVVPSKRLPLVDFRLISRAGSVDDPVGKEGLADLTSDLMTQGAGSRDAQKLAEDIAFIGGTIEAAASSEQ